MLEPNLSVQPLQLRKITDKTQVFDPVRKRWMVLTPEEHVRQLVLQYLIQEMQYPASLLAVERQITAGTRIKRYDIVVFGRSHLPWMLVECKAPEVPVSEKTLHQLLSYHRTVQCRYWLLTNGHETHCADAGDAMQIKWLPSLPAYDF